MVEQPEPNNDPEHIDPEHIDPQTDPQPATPVTAQQKLKLLWQRVPPRFRQKRYVICGSLAAVALVFVAGDAIGKSLGGPDTPDTPVAVATEPTPTPVTSLLPDRPTPTPLPSQYAFTHFVREMSACYRQRGLESNLEGVEADIMQDVPLAVNELMKLYANNECEEDPPWHQIKGRVGWMLRAADVPLP